MQNSTKAHLALVGTNLFFAINFTAVKYLINAGLVKPFGLNLIRIAVTALLLWVIYLFGKERTTIRKKDWGRFALCALTGIAINQLLFIKGLSLTYPIHASLLMLTTPILITVIAAWLLKERLNGNKVFGLILGIAGSVVLITGRSRTADATDVLWGDVLVVINAVSYTFYFVLVKPLMQQYNPIVVIRMVFTLGFIMVLPFCWNEFSQTAWNGFQPKDWMVLVTIVIGGTFLAYLFNVYGIKTLGASVAGSYIYAQPVFATIIAIIFFGEQLDWYKIAAAVLIFSGVYLVTKTKTDAGNN